MARMDPTLILKAYPWATVLIVLWTLPWKGWALWKAAKRGDRNWFIVILILNTLAILDIIYIFYVSREVAGTDEEDGIENLHTTDSSIETLGGADDSKKEIGQEKK
jgi:hypothetical protein